MPDQPPRPTIAILGGGFCGAVTALHLMRDHPELAADIVIVEPRARLGAGLAYGTVDPEHRINVAADRMSPFPEHPDHFDAWLRAHAEPDADPDSRLPDGRLFARRSSFGRYVDATLHEAAAAAPNLTLRHLRDRAVDAIPTRATPAPATPAPANPGRAGAPLALALANGTRLQADAVVLALGNPAPDLPFPLAGLRGHPGLVADPWDTRRLAAIDPDAAVLVVGTGLTACDVLASLRAHGHAGPITMVSRRGLLPRPRTSLAVTQFGRFDDAPETTALGLLRRIRRAIAAAHAEGRPWEDIVAALREQARPVWTALPLPERTRLLRHLRPFWDVHRFQCAPQIDALLRREQHSGGVQVRAATPTGARSEGPDLIVELRPRGATVAETHRFDAVVSCTGPGHRSVVASTPVLHSLDRAGALAPDPLGLGIAVDAENHVLGHDGHPNPRLFVAGPLARGRHGELMGLPQVSTQPREVAASIARLLGAT